MCDRILNLDEWKAAVRAAHPTANFLTYRFSTMAAVGERYESALVVGVWHSGNDWGISDE